MPPIPASEAPALAWESPGAGWAFFFAFVILVLVIGTAFWWWGRRRRRPQDPM
ncbi:hypothetical protein [Phytomonospora endophytica]|uniref:LPXTG cell wall anchor domain-containing protein n=1 Tax=Phytomonospora endophytica TaxID=714109 RepID=A0A841FJK7_9ACTN|nr:hypothetical protein [Phytomonospora endophytica]MBB6036015.1 hypothetical protein [Phytomonospora endophytica]GIG66920.1 hypothetical protein Pen01_32150 [Phytomonospora endophytica]